MPDVLCNNSNDSNKHDGVYATVIMSYETDALATASAT